MVPNLLFVLALICCAVLHVQASVTAFNGSGRGNSVDPGSEAAPCPTGWVIGPNDSKCFSYMGSPQSWKESENECKHNGGHLAALTSFQELNFAHNLCKEVVNGCWVGGRVVNSTTGFSWKWSDNASYWNESILSGPNFQFNCTSSPCPTKNSFDLCTLMTNNGSTPFTSERCNKSHAFICMLDIGDICSHMHCHKEYLIILAVVSGLILCTTLAVVVWLLAYKRSKKRRRSRKLSNPAASALVPPSWKVFTKEELKSITKNFSEGNRLLGDAKTGGTYSGLLPEGSRVAVKRLKRSSFQRKKEFYSEIGRVARLHHPNLVAVKGCCYDHGDRYIVYEFIVNGPLDRWLHHIPRGGRSLDWAMRMKIATTLAQGIAFLHDKVKPHVVHRDIRASNVLLDEEFGAHLMGVGLSKFVPYEAHRYPDLLDPHISSSSSDIPEAGVIQKVVDLVYACTQHVPSMRPRMSHVVHQLQQLAQPPIVK
ncbi:c-type lectin receptor-like tyrosine-protein kinase [Quercus suber]|uniref:C-type lectin receptor-like tyrosine-protein kinase n=1 Tax=Quercus suber TaxID=58331 RepID=A0AAW0KEK2_QUESU